MEDTIRKMQSLISAGDAAQALEYFETLQEEERNSWEIQNLAGVACTYCGQLEQALEFFLNAFRQRPNDADLLYNLAEIYCALGQYQKAEEMLARCEQQNITDELRKDISLLRGEMGVEPEVLFTEQRKKVLMVAYYFPPLAGSGVFRSLKFAKYLSRFSWHPTVISTDLTPFDWNFSDQSLVEEIPDDVKVFRVPDLIRTGRETSLSENRVNSICTFLHDVLRYNKEADDIFSAVARSHNGIEALLTFPCAALSWAYDAVQYIEKNLDVHQLQVIYTTSGPASAHLVGFYFKQKYGIPWVADYRDLWTGNPYDSYTPSNPRDKLIFCLESVLLQQADCNISVGEEWTRSFVDRFHIPEERVACITNGYDESDFTSLKIPVEKTDKFTINYSGLIYTKHRSIVPILKAIQQLYIEKKIDLAQIRFRIVGNAEPSTVELAKKYKLDSILVQTGYIPHKEALQSNLDADMLLLLVGDQSNMRGFHTAKLFDYLRCGRPVLAFAPKGGVVDEILRETGHGESCLSTQTSRIKSVILREYQSWQQRDKAAVLRHSPLIERFERKRLTEQLVQVFEKVEGGTAKAQEIPSSAYDAAYQNGGPGGSYHKHYTESHYYRSWKLALTHLYFLDHNLSILEIGCGPGQFANMLFDAGFSNYTGFDYNAEGIALARKNNPDHADCFFVADAFQTHLLEKHYDLIICFEVLEHIQNDIELLQRIQPGTKLLISVPNFNDPYHVRYFGSEDEVQERYQKVMRIFDVQLSVLNAPFSLYYIAGEKR